MAEKKQKPSRRDFLKSTSVLGVAAATGGALAGYPKMELSADSLPDNWDHETDVLVIGYGLAGASAALTADEAGADVLIIEKMDEEKGGGNSKVSGNLIYIPGNAEDGETYFRAMCKENMHDISDEMIQVWIDGMLENRTWIEENLGADLMPLSPSWMMGPEFPFLPASDTQLIYMVNGGLGNGALFLPVHDLVRSRRLNIMYETAADKLLTDESGNVVGVMAKSAGGDIAIKARKGVILCCGSFEFNDSMKANYMRGPCWGLGNIGNTGDGISMTQALGADLWHMNNAMGPLFFGFIAEDLEGDFPEALRIIEMSNGSYFWTDIFGQRFMNEKSHHYHGKGFEEWNYFDAESNSFSRNPCWLVFDQAGLEAGPLGLYSAANSQFKIGFAGWYGDYVWSDDNSAEVERGWIKQADSIEGLAEELDMDPAALAETLVKFNSYVAGGEDEEYERPAGSMEELSGPFYAIKLYPGMVNTQGGPKRNPQAQVMHVEGHPIPRLYSAGELGSIYSWMYQGGGNLGECLYTGRIAGRNAADEESL